MLFLLLFVMVCWSISAGLVALASVSTPHISDDSSIPDFEYNHDNRLANNMLIYQNSQECKSLAEQLVSMHPYDRKLAPATTEFHSAFFGSDPIDGECNVACLEIGSPSHLVTHVFPHRIHSIKSVDESYSWYHKTCQKKEIGFCNTQEGLVNVYWMNDDGERVWVGNVTTGERNTFWISSFVGHSFEVTDSESGVLLGQFTVHSDSFFSFEKLESFRAVDFVPEQYPDLTTAVGDIFETEYERHNSVSRHFTGVGFNKGRLPKDLFNSMTTFYYNNHPYRIHELANRKSVYINWWESDIHYISMPYRLRVSILYKLELQVVYDLLLYEFIITYIYIHHRNIGRDV